MEVAAVEEVVTSQPDPVVSVVGRFEQFKRDSRKRIHTEAQGKWYKRERKLGCTIRRART